ncbi:MAG: ABC transporter substrate-binding protein [Phycisphaerae bacterium]
MPHLRRRTGLRSFHKLRLLGLALLLAAVPLLAASGCDSAEPDAVTLQLNWLPEPQFGGFYTAELDGDYEAQGLNVTVREGSVGVVTQQMLAAGSVPFAIVSGDQLVRARAEGQDLVALFAVYQTNPQGILTHAGRGFETLADVFAAPGTLAIEEGLPYAEFLRQTYGFGSLRIVQSTGGSVQQFLADPTFSQQCFVTSEPIKARDAGAAVKTFLVAEAGFNPYTTVLATNGQFLKDNPDICRQMTAAVRAGWERYLADPTPTNRRLLELNPSFDAATMAASAERQVPLIRPAAGTASDSAPVGTMTEQRWQQLIDQMNTLGLLDKPVVAADCFRNL